MAARLAPEGRGMRRPNQQYEQIELPRGKNPGRAQVIWITGLSGAGKSTLAREVVRLLRLEGEAALLLDGDEIRSVVDDGNTGHDRTGRLANAFRVCRFARLVADQGIPAVVATMSLFKEVHAWNREHLPNYFEVFLKVGLEVLQKRDARGLYSRAARGAVDNVVGVHLEYDEPAAPDLVLVNENASIPDLAGEVLRRIFRTQA
jgi:adenylylsulfate kinase